MGKAREYDPVTDFPKHWCGNDDRHNKRMEE